MMQTALGSENTEDALNCRYLSAKELLIIGLLIGLLYKELCNGVVKMKKMP